MVSGCKQRSVGSVVDKARCILSVLSSGVSRGEIKLCKTDCKKCSTLLVTNGDELFGTVISRYNVSSLNSCPERYRNGSSSIVVACTKASGLSGCGVYIHRVSPFSCVGR